MAVKDRVGDCEAALITPEEAMLAKHQRIFREKKWKRVKYHEAGYWVFSKQKKNFLQCIEPPNAFLNINPDLSTLIQESLQEIESHSK